MGNSPHNLSGKWDGEFRYPDAPEAGPFTPFVATVSDNAGVIAGTIMEPHEYDSGTVHATMLGQRIGHSVHFAKDYHDAGDHYRETVLYFGHLSEDGNIISGEWQIDHWRGPFEMSRELSISEAAGAIAAQEVEMSR